ncbi:MAG: hypothetical protein ACQETK_08485 [Pseudomonadota bacterium]
MLWILGVGVAIVLLDLARQPIRRLLVVLAGALARLTCGLRRQVLHLRDAVGDWHRRHLDRLEAEQVQAAVNSLERRYARLVGHDLAQLPGLRQEAHRTLETLQAAYARDEGRLVEEPAWATRLEALANAPVADNLQSHKLGQDLRETLLRIARLGIEEHRQEARGLLAARRRMEGPVNELNARLKQLQGRLRDLERQGERLDMALTRCEETAHPIRRLLPAYAQAGTQWLVALAGLVLTLVSVAVYRELFGPALGGLFPQPIAVAPLALHDQVVAVLLGVAAVSGWLLTEVRGVSRLLPQSLFDDAWARRMLGVLAGVVLAGVVMLSAMVGWHLEWVIYRQELVDSLLAGEEGVLPVTLGWVERGTGALLGVVIPLVLALVPLWLVGILQGTRVLVGAALTALLGLLAGILHLLAVLACQLRRLLPAGFELLIFVPQAIRRWRTGRAEGL